MKKGLTTLLVITVAVVAGVLAKYGVRWTTTSTPEQQHAETEKRLRQMVEKIRSTLPQKVDDLTTMIGIRNEGVMTIYNYRLEVDTNTLDNTDRKGIRDHITKTICDNEQMQKSLRVGATYRYIYSDKNSKLVTNFDVGQRDC